MQKAVLKDIGIRAFKTFWQAFIAALAVANVSDLNSLKAAVIAAAAAGVSAVWNLLLAVNSSRKQ